MIIIIITITAIIIISFLAQYFDGGIQRDSVLT